MKNSFRRLLLASLIALGATACSDSTGPEADPIEGAYTLQTINGRPLPVELLNFFNTYRLVQLNGTMTLNSNRTFRETDTLRETFPDANGVTINADTTIVLTGAWQAQDSVITLTTTRDNSILFGSVRRGRLTLHYEAANDSLFTFVYRKD